MQFEVFSKFYIVFFIYLILKELIFANRVLRRPQLMYL